MSLFSRIRYPMINYLSYQFKRCHIRFSAPCLADYLLSTRQIGSCSINQPNRIFQRRPGEVSDNARFFAAPAQVKKKVEEKEPEGPRLNEQIKARGDVRLVTDEGHGLVPLKVALQRARELMLDLVEVQREPCVVKIMDYNKERYMQQVKEKDRAKAKSTMSLRKGVCKEVRCSPKCEQKDLKMKADTAKRLMERGYRVKCMVMGTEEQDLGGVLSRLSSMIEDVAVVESGPRVEKKQAYIIVRHEKFGPTKKSGKKAAKADSSDARESDLEASDDFETENSADKSKGNDSSSINAQRMEGIGQKAKPSISAQPQPEIENRYVKRGAGPREGTGRAQWTNNRVNREARNSHQELNWPRQGGPGWDIKSDGQAGPGGDRQGYNQVDPKWNPGINNQVGPDARNFARASNEIPKREVGGIGERSNQSTSYGVFSSPNANHYGGQRRGALSSGQNSEPRGAYDFHRNAGPRTGPSDAGSPLSRSEGNSDDGRWGLFSKESSHKKEDQGLVRGRLKDEL